MENSDTQGLIPQVPNINTQPARCCGKVNPGGQWGAFHMTQCKLKAAVYRDGKPYCKRHDPVARKERLDKSMEKDRIKWEHRSRKERAHKEAIELLRESQKSIGGDWRQRRDACLIEIDTL